MLHRTTYREIANRPRKRGKSRAPHRLLSLPSDGPVSRYVYRAKEAKHSGGLKALLYKHRRRSTLKSRVDNAVKQAVLAFALDNHADRNVGGS
jgi:hypothetical protein